MKRASLLETVQEKDRQIRDLNRELIILRHLEGISLWKHELEERIEILEKIQRAILTVLPDETVQRIMAITGEKL